MDTNIVCRLLKWTLFALFPFSTQAGDGRMELNQAAIEADGGFPYTLSQAGSYVLTGNLTVPAGTDGLVISANYVSIDLNGFLIQGTGFVCLEGNCTPGAGVGIKRQTSLSANQAGVRNGTVFGFASHCIQLNDKAHVEDMKVLHCGGSGIIADDASVVTRNVVSNVGALGLNIGEGSTYAHNSISLAGLDGGQATVSGGNPTAGNFCDDGNCDPHGRRLFYVSQDSVMGNQALDQCEEGFHMASLYEMVDLSNFRYDPTRGVTRLDMGEGPPSQSGWVRTGIDSDTSQFPGEANCAVWDSDSSEHRGSTVSLNINWVDPPGLSATWSPGIATCDSPRPVWCVQD